MFNNQNLPIILLCVVFVLEKVPTFITRHTETRENAEVFTEAHSISFVL